MGHFNFMGINLIQIAPILVVAALVTTPYWLGPLLVKASMKHSAENRFQRIWLNSIPLEAQSAFDMATRGLAARGFKALAHLTAAKPSNLVEDSYISIWANLTEGDTAQVIAVRVKKPDGTYSCDPLVTFRREFTDNTRIVTSNTRTPSAFPRDPQTDAVILRDCWDFELLYEVHQALARLRHPGQRGTLPPLGTDDAIIEAFHKENIRDMERVSAAGYFFFDSSLNAYRPTIKGSIIMTWRLLWPLKQLRMRQRDDAADGALSEIGFGGLSQFRARQRPMMPYPVPGAFGFPVASPQEVPKSQ